MTEIHEHRLKRVHMRSWRRGMKEMDMILGPYATAELSKLPLDVLDSYERLLGENDQDLYKWVSGAVETPALHVPMIERIAVFHGIR